MSDKRVVVFFDDNNALQVNPEILRVSGGDRVTFQFDTDATIDMAGGAEGVNQLLTDTQKISGRRGETRTIQINNAAESNIPSEGFTYNVKANNTQTTTRSSTSPKMILE
ncbi:MAG: hypothetical protein Kow0042_08010 [Calditrichia bacterium]